MATLKDGARLGSYQIIRPLGSGGMGEVYLARDLRLDREVAIKIIGETFAEAPERLQRFIREAKTASSLNHPNIAHVYEIGECDGLHFIVMEYVRGEALNRRIGSRGMPITDVIVYATQMADALDEAHSHGVVHRDLKPANVMITARRKVKILDFGLAKIMSASGEQDSMSTMAGDTMAGVILGTLDYMSPEQVRGLPLDRRTDIFSFGVMLYEMIAGRVPFAGSSKTDTVYRITQVQPEALNRYNYEVPADLERIVRKCLEKEPDRRYQSVRELLVDLSSLRRDSSGLTLPPATVAAGRTRRTQWFVMGALALLAVAALAGTLAWRREDVINSIAVIPIASSSAGLQAIELADGVAAKLTHSLSRLPNLTVAPRRMVSMTDGDVSDPAEIARQLEMHAVLTVRVAMRGETATVSLDLVDVDHPRQVWGEQYSRRVNEIELAERSISENVIEMLRPRLSAGDRREMEVYQLYQSGRYHADKRTPNDLQKAIELYEVAIQKDRNYALAYAGLADAYNLLPAYNVMSPRESSQKAKAAAERAIRIDETLAEAHTALGLVFFRSEWNWPAAEREFARAIALDQTDAEAHHWAGMYFAAMGRFEESMAQVREAQILDPLSPVFRADPGWTLYLARQYTQAIQAAERAAAADPDALQPQRYLGLAQTQLGNFGRAIEALQATLLLSGAQSALHQAELAHAYASAGRRTEASRIFGELSSRRNRTYVSAYSLALVAAALNDAGAALDLLDTAVVERDPLLVWAKVDPRLDSLRNQARFLSVVSTLRLQ